VSARTLAVRLPRVSRQISAGTQVWGSGRCSRTSPSQQPPQTAAAARGQDCPGLPHPARKQSTAQERQTRAFGQPRPCPRPGTAFSSLPGATETPLGTAAAVAWPVSLPNPCPQPKNQLRRSKAASPRPAVGWVDVPTAQASSDCQSLRFNLLDKVPPKNKSGGLEPQSPERGGSQAFGTGRGGMGSRSPLLSRSPSPASPPK